MEQPSHNQPLTTAGSNSNTMLMEEIIVEILIRLPVKSIVRFKLVSKQWLSLLTSRDFVDRHLHQSLKPNSNRLLLLLDHFNLKGGFSLYTISMHDPQYKLSIEHKLVPKPLTVMDPYDVSDMYMYSVVGICNGVICITESKSEVFTLYNPSNRSLRRVTAENRGCLGLGYDAIADDYKILGIEAPMNEVDWVHGNFCGEIWIFSLRRNTWKYCNSQLPCKFHNLCTTDGYLNGALHWVLDKGRGNDLRYSVLFFDLHKETFNPELLPDCFQEYENFGADIGLGILGSQLCLQVNNFGCLDVWLMKEYGLMESWTKLFSLRYMALLYCQWDPRVLTYSSDMSKLLLQLGNTRAWYGLKTRELVIKEDGLCPILSNDIQVHEGDVCIESLVSLGAY